MLKKRKHSYQGTMGGYFNIFVKTGNQRCIFLCSIFLKSWYNIFIVHTRHEDSEEPVSVVSSLALPESCSGAAHCHCLMFCSFSVLYFLRRRHCVLSGLGWAVILHLLKGRLDTDSV